MSNEKTRITLGNFGDYLNEKFDKLANASYLVNSMENRAFLQDPALEDPALQVASDNIARPSKYTWDIADRMKEWKQSLNAGMEIAGAKQILDENFEVLKEDPRLLEFYQGVAAGELAQKDFKTFMAQEDKPGVHL